MFRTPPEEGEEDWYEEERFTGSLILADWYHRRVARDEADEKSANKSKGKRRTSGNR